MSDKLKGDKPAGDKIQFFVLDVKYKVVNGKSEIYLFSKTKKGKSIIVIDTQFEPFFYVIPKKNHELSEKIEKLKVEKNEESYEVTKTETLKMNYNGKEVDVIKVYTNLPRDISVIRDIIKDWEMVASVNEYDFPFSRRYLADKEITPLTLLEAEVELIVRKSKVPVFEAKSLKQVGDDTLTEPKILAIDIETYNDGKAVDFEKNPILMVSFYGQNYQKVITWKKFKTKEKYIEFVEDEAELVSKFKEIVEAIQPDIITGYYSDGFDLPYINKRAQKYKVKLDLGLDHSEMSVTSRGVSKAKIAGIVHLDTFSVIKKLFSQSLKTDFYDLGSVSEELLGDKKTDVELDNLADVWDNHPSELGIYCEYNLQDSKLAFNLAEKILPNVIEMVKIVGLPIFDVTRMGFSQLVEWYLIKRSHLSNVIVPNKPGNEELKDRMINKYEGAFVFEPTPGLYKDIIIFDFRSLYPTIISSHNISPSMLNCNCCESEKVPLEGTDYRFCKNKKGFLAGVIDDLIQRRMRIKEMMKRSKNDLLDARQNNLKVLSNAFYGYFGFFNARWYSLECARSITAYGRYYIHQVIDSAIEQGFKVIYSDTDSIFMVLDGKTKKQAKDFADSINPKLPGIMELEYEGCYPSGIFVSAKAGAYGAKKKYALLDNSGELYIKGFETVRRNWSTIAKEVQRKVLDIVLKEDNPDKALRYVRGMVDDLRKNKIDVSKVIIKTQLKKEIESYDSIGPHVAIAKRLRNQGQDVVVGMIIEFVVTEGKGKIGDKARLPSEVIDNKYDSEYYVNNQVIPAVEMIFKVLGYTKDDLASEKEQSKLGAFFK
jgi:DNA polymerase, archaea type